MSTTGVRIESVTGDSDRVLEQIADLLVAAFADDPGMQLICQHERDGYTKRLRHWFWATLRLYRANHQPLLIAQIASQYVACVVLTKPDANLRHSTVLRWLWETTRKAGIRSVWRTLSHLRRISQYQPGSPHFRLEFVAVHPSYQGKGFGRMLLDETHRLAETDQRTTGVWLETANPQNVPMYKRFGYEVKNQLQMDDIVETILMFRAHH